MPPVQCCLVSTLCDAQLLIEDFIQHHLRQGFVRLYLFLDAPCAATQAIIQRYPQVRLWQRDGELLALWQQVAASLPPGTLSLVVGEVMARQELNLAVAMAEARREGMDWLLHIDSDELFYSPTGNAPDHFAGLTAVGVENVRYLNYEAYSHEQTEGSPFRQLHWFKRNFFFENRWTFSDAQRALLRAKGLEDRDFFNFYQNGKSAVALHGQTLIEGVHKFKTASPRFESLDKGPIILHYPCWDYQAFCQKYRRLGAFSNLWKGHRRVGKYMSFVHFEARDALVAGNDALARQLFTSRLLQPPADELQALQALDMVVRLTPLAVG